MDNVRGVIQVNEINGETSFQVQIELGIPGWTITGPIVTFLGDAVQGGKEVSRSLGLVIPSWKRRGSAPCEFYERGGFCNHDNAVCPFAGVRAECGEADELRR